MDYPSFTKLFNERRKRLSRFLLQAKDSNIMKILELPQLQPSLDFLPANPYEIFGFNSEMFALPRLSEKDKQLMEHKMVLVECEGVGLVLFA
ncbi:hypothetical protein FNV43_RR24902 [Rhamnella rubrinervis]|uniref:Uncharacterized protein n=1 Tax=Rhamnella rubrinervis TaxID=2594499 RepID=A0A8K0DT64_9ROSA|nr:hypothetical protein FNV43_RR24902 [Rhamnella rubrinervis]